MGEVTASHMASVSYDKCGKWASQRQRDRPLTVSGIGKGTDLCQWNAKIPIALPTPNGSCVECTFDSPIVPNSHLPALFGLRSMQQQRAIIDTNTMRMYFVGPGDYDMEKMLPPGTTSIQCQTSPSGHMVVPTDSYAKTKVGGVAQQELSLLANTSSVSTSSSSSSKAPKFQ